MIDPVAKGGSARRARYPEAPRGGRAGALRVSGLALLLFFCACEQTQPKALLPAPAPASAGATPAPLSAPTRAQIPEGSFLSGTEPGRFPRDPKLEPRTKRLALGAFEIDIQPRRDANGPLTVTRERARELCSEQRGRLCTELEWERACKGPESRPFASGDDWDPTCAAPDAKCASGFGVIALGSLREWTASEVEERGSRRAVLRGAAGDASPPQHRCAYRSWQSGAAAALAAFRCCYGPPNAARVELPELGPTFTRVELPATRLAELLSAAEETRNLASDLSYFTDPEASRVVLERGSGDTRGFLFTTAPLHWNPAPGAEFLVLAARSGRSTSFVAAFHVLGRDAYRLASSFVMQNEPGPVALAYNGYIRPRLHFSSCWGCPGETGKVLYREPDQAVILQP